MIWGDLFDIDTLKLKLQSLETELCQPEIWSDIKKSQALTKQKKQLEIKVLNFESLYNQCQDIFAFIELAEQENDLSLLPEIKSAKNKFVSEFESFRISNLLSGEYDFNNAIVSLHSGAGGTEACDWVDMLFRMYGKWCDKNNFSFKVMDYLPGEEAGIKSVTFEVKGDNAYGYLKSERGVHRLIRISPFDASGRRHTSFASCEVMPEINDEIEIKIAEDEIRIDTYRSSGAGGQHVNTTDSAIRITHLPTGIVVQCQNERSQIQNREFAMNMLRAKLLSMKIDEQRAKLEGIRGQQKEIAWGSQIRTYVFHPYNLVKDHRTNVETGNVRAVMDGDIDLFINSYLTSFA